ncbi:MAG: hypothetical protein VW665_00505 [Candidatus Puniceispirillum sp.]
MTRADPETDSDSLNSTVSRPDLSNRVLRLSAAGLGVATLIYAGIKPSLGSMWQQPGSPLMQSFAIIGSLFLLVPYLFSLGKRGGYSRVPNRLFMLHVGASVIGIGFVVPHGLAYFDGPPLLMLGGLMVLVITGLAGRIYASKLFAAVFGQKPKPFALPDPETKEKLRAIIAQKITLLASLDKDADEALFSVTLAHLLRQPRLSLAYLRLARIEASLIQTRQSVPFIAAYWRPLHILVAWLFLAGLIIHIIVVTFFAGYVAEGRPIYWWHITQW